MIYTYIDNGNPYMIEPETDEERRFLELCPAEWSLIRVSAEYLKYQHRIDEWCQSHNRI